MKQPDKNQQSGTVAVKINGETTENVSSHFTTDELIGLMRFDWVGQLPSRQTVSHFKISFFGDIPPGTYDLADGEVLVQYFTVNSGTGGSTGKSSAPKPRRMAQITEGTLVLSDLTPSHLKADLDFIFAGSTQHTVSAQIDVGLPAH
ncbi:hypothetical protein [Pseudomonas sp. DSP3-2-2]|uniref:hypothetical protein n=1 Tax=unclassified Pseudomonas TaxID=196821 RepID=UPI003CF86656